MSAAQMKTDFAKEKSEKELPLVVKAVAGARDGNSSLRAPLEQNRQDFLQDKLLAHGALLFRGFEIQSTVALEKFARLFSQTDLWNYCGGVSPRRKFNRSVYASTDYPSNLTLALHNELSYSEKYPGRLYFCCAVAPTQGGETTVGDSRQILKRLPPEIVAEFKRKKVMYVRHLFSRESLSAADQIYSWQNAFETDNPLVVENHCRQINANFKWSANDSLLLEQIRPATAVHSVTHEEVWFNQATGFHPSELDRETYQNLIELMPEDEFRLNSRFGDGSLFDLNALDQIREVLREETVPVRWEQGDVLVIDNVLTAHGRLPFVGARQILLAMA